MRCLPPPFKVLHSSFKFFIWVSLFGHPRKTQKLNGIPSIDLAPWTTFHQRLAPRVVVDLRQATYPFTTSLSISKFLLSFEKLTTLSPSKNPLFAKSCRSCIVEGNFLGPRHLLGSPQKRWDLLAARPLCEMQVVLVCRLEQLLALNRCKLGNDFAWKMRQVSS